MDTLTAYSGATQKAQNYMSYREGELSEVTDGKVRYGFDVDRDAFYDTTVMQVYDGSWKTLEEMETDHVENRLTHKYYREDDEVTDTFVYTTDKYGKPTVISYNSEQKVTYNYTEGSESEAVWLLASVNDQFCGRTYSYEYNADGSQKSVSMAGFSVEKVNESEKKYTVENNTLTQTVVQDTRLISVSNKLNDDAPVMFTKFYTYNSFGRTTAKQVRNYTSETEYSVVSETSYGYCNTHMLPLSETYQRNGDTMYALTYGYDARGNVQSVSNGTETTTYEYDALNRLTKENNKIYTYDASGRMTSFNGTAMNYDSRGRLTSFGSTTLTYDNYGNRLTKGDFVYTWMRGRLLASMNNATYEYDRNGVRTKKHLTWTNVTKEYFYDGDKLICEKHSDGNTLYFFYDESGVCGVRYNDSNFEYVKNIFGDVIAIYDEYNQCVAEYTYDAWGNMTSCNAYHVFATINPILYRGYYYDTESGLYYLMSRYYDPEIGQFISMDTPDYLAPETIGGVDLYAYGLNNPVMYVDPTGHSVLALLIFLGVGAISIGGLMGWSSYNEGKRGWELAKDIVLGISLGIAAGGLAFAIGAAGWGLLGKSMFFSFKIKEAFALGVLVYDLVALIIAPLYGIEMEVLELGENETKDPGPQENTTLPWMK